ncbi:MAG TPA: cupin domain-containing protein [Gemmatimonadales bacterium]
MRPVSAAVLFAALSLTAAAHAQAPAIQWGPAPAVFPAGTQLAVLQGDPGQNAMFTVRLSFPAGTRIQPHFHPTDEHVTVISGTFLVGMGDSLDLTKVTALPAGSFITAAANMHHYAIARGRTVVQISAVGPFALTYVHPQDQPQTSSTK